MVYSVRGETCLLFEFSLTIERRLEGMGEKWEMERLEGTLEGQRGWGGFVDESE